MAISAAWSMARTEKRRRNMLKLDTISDLRIGVAGEEEEEETAMAASAAGGDVRVLRVVMRKRDGRIKRVSFCRMEEVSEFVEGFMDWILFRRF